MATAPETITAEPALVLTPPDPVPVVAPEKAVGLVPVDDAKRSELQKRVETFIDDLVAQDVNSPEFGKRVDAISAMGQKEIRDAAGQSNRFLDRPTRAMGHTRNTLEMDAPLDHAGLVRRDLFRSLLRSSQPDCP